ncbi:MAG: glycosyltransferase involved in cell wall biosynthesis [Urechidicola sp.]
MKVLHITNGYPNEVYPTYCIFIKEQVDSLSAQGICNEVIVINPKKKRLFGYISGFIKMLVLLNRHKSVDVYHCHHILSAFLLILSNPFKKRNIVLAFLNDKKTEMSNLPFPLFLSKLLYNYVYNRVSYFIVKNDSKLTLKNKHVFYLPNGVNTDMFKPLDRKQSRFKLNLPIKKHLILFVSAISIREQKRYDRFKEVIELLKNKYNLDVEAVLMINEKRSDIPYFFNACDVHLLTSDYEGSPNSVKEAMSCNMKVVSTNVGNVSDLFEGVNNCSMVNSFDVNDLALATKNILFRINNTENNSRDQIMNLGLDMQSVAKKLSNIYQFTLKS